MMSFQKKLLRQGLCLSTVEEREERKRRGDISIISQEVTGICKSN